MSNKQLIIVNDPLDVKTWERVETNKLIDYLIERFGKWPAHARLYHQSVAEENDITPRNDLDIAHIATLDGLFYVVIYPGEAISAVVYILAAVFAVAAFALKPKIPNVAQRASNSKSPNNELSARTNSARPNARIPDIFGTVRSTPDLICVPFTQYVNNREVETSTMCIGRGQYEIHDCKDGSTSLAQIDGASVSIFKPDTDVAVDAPYFAIGAPLTGPVMNITRNDAINGQTLDFPNFKQFVGDANIVFELPNRMTTVGFSNRTFSAIFVPGDVVQLTNALQFDDSLTQVGLQIAKNSTTFMIKLASAVLPPWLNIGDDLNLLKCVFHLVVVGPFGQTVKLNDCKGKYVVTNLTLVNISGQDWCEVELDDPVSVNPLWADNDIANWFPVEGEFTADVNDTAFVFDLAGTYEISAVADKFVEFVSPELVNPDWLDIPVAGSALLSSSIQTVTYKWVGPFVMDQADTTRLITNFVASGGLYFDDGKTVFPLYINVFLEVTPIDNSDVPTGPPVVFTTTVSGEYFSTDSKGQTLIASPVLGRCMVRAARQTPKLDAFLMNGSIVDEIKWKDLYSASQIDNTNFGNVTIIRSQTVGTTGALSLKERRLNMLVTRQIPLRISGSTFTSDLHSTNRADEIIAEVCKDPRIGNRPNSEIDFTNIYTEIAIGELYFGFPESIEFSYTFDEDKMNFEDTVQAIASAVCCTAYRQGSLIKLKLERATVDSTLLFNHRNKTPGSETRTMRFGNNNDNDGVAFTYVSPIDDAVVTKYIPEDRSAKKEKKIESIGIRNDKQAHIQAHRAFNKIKYQNLTTKFRATEESELLVIADRILVADNTRPETQDGEITGVAGLICATSQPVKFEAGSAYTVFLQLFNGTVQSIPVSGLFGDPYAMVLAFAPALSLVVEDDRFAKTQYCIVKNTDARQTAFLVTERTSGEQSVSEVTAINYSDRYYENDKDYLINPDVTFVKSLGDLILWLNAQPIDTFVTSGGKLSQWRDMSDEENHSTQPNPDIRPLPSTALFVPRGVKFEDELT